MYEQCVNVKTQALKGSAVVRRSHPAGSRPLLPGEALFCIDQKEAEGRVVGSSGSHLLPGEGLFCIDQKEAGLAS